MESTSVETALGSGPHPNPLRGRGGGGLHRNKQWVAGENRSRSHTPQSGYDSAGGGAGGDRWERGGAPAMNRGRGRGRGAGHFGSRKFVRDTSKESNSKPAADAAAEKESVQEQEKTVVHPDEEPFLETQEEREKFWQELVRAREVERRLAISTGKMDDPLVPKRLSEAITMVGTCPDMCPRFERYRRERENNLAYPWETINSGPGSGGGGGGVSRRVDHRRAVKMYERAAGDKTLPSDLRPPDVLRRTLDYLFHELIPQHGFIETFSFVRDRTRSVRNDFTMQHEQGEVARESHERCARFHVLALHLMRGAKGKAGEGFSVNLEEQQLMNTLQSLKEFYTDQRPSQPQNSQPVHVFPSELEMRIYHRLIHIRDQRERHDDVPPLIQAHPVFQLVTKFRLVVQRKSAPISKTSKLVVDEEAMGVFAELAGVLQDPVVLESAGGGNLGGNGMIYLIACLLEHLFGKETIEDIEAIRAELGYEHVIDGAGSGGGAMSRPDDIRMETGEGDEEQEEYGEMEAEGEGEDYEEEEEVGAEEVDQLVATGSTPAPVPSIPTSAPSAFSNLTTISANPFGGTMNVFGQPAFGQPVSQTQTQQNTVQASSSSPFGKIQPSLPFGTTLAQQPQFQPSLAQEPQSRPPLAQQPQFPPSLSQTLPSSGLESPFTKPSPSPFSTSSSSSFLVPPSQETYSKSKIFSSQPSSLPKPQPPPSGDTTVMGLNPQAPLFVPGIGKRLLADMPPLGGDAADVSSAGNSDAAASTRQTETMPQGLLWGSGIATSTGGTSGSTYNDASSITTTTNTMPFPSFPSSVSSSPPFSIPSQSTSTSNSTPAGSKPPTPTLTISTSFFPPSQSAITQPQPSQSQSTSTSEPQPGTPTIPPPLPRYQPISLPPSTPVTGTGGFGSPPSVPRTPSMTMTTPMLITPSKTHPRLGSLKTSGLGSPGSGSGAGAGTEILSPLTPSLSRAGSLKTFSSLGSFGSLGSFTTGGSGLVEVDGDGERGRDISPMRLPPPSLFSSSSKDKGKAKARSKLDDLTAEEEGTESERRARLFGVRRAFAMWKSRARKRVEEKERWEEAVQRGERYRERLSVSVSESESKAGGKKKDLFISGAGKRRREESRLNGVDGVFTNGLAVNGRQSPRYTHTRGTSLEERWEEGDVERSPVKKRPRRYPHPRKSGPVVNGAVVPRTDEELAKRLAENATSHRLRWTPGSFLDMLRQFVKKRGGKVGDSFASLSSSRSRLSASASSPFSLNTSSFSLSSSTPHPSSHPDLSLISSSVSSSLNLASLASTYTIWLSLNPAVDSTAIWVQTKFGVPESGWWRSLSAASEEHVFEIPLVPAGAETPSQTVKSVDGEATNPRSPGIIIFETTPLSDDMDELEKKYVVLDDCTRLRDILGGVRRGSNPSGSGELEDADDGEERFFVPSLLFVHWSAEESGKDGGEAKRNMSSGLPEDLANMVTRAMSSDSDPVLSSYSVLSLTSSVKAEELDGRFDRALDALSSSSTGTGLDLDGRLVQVVQGPGLGSVFKIFKPTFDAFVNEWLDNCASASPSAARGYGFNGYFNWPLHSQLLRVVGSLINEVGDAVVQLVSKSSMKSKVVSHLPSYPSTPADDLESVYGTTIGWLVQIGEAMKDNEKSMIESIIVDVQSHSRMGKVFPTRTFIEQLWDVVRWRLEITIVDSGSTSFSSTSTSLSFSASSSAPASLSSLSSAHLTHSTYLLPLTRISFAQESFEESIKSHQVALSRSLNKYLGFRTPRQKRRSFGSDTESNTSKRLRLSDGSNGSFASIPPSASTSIIDLDQIDTDNDNDNEAMSFISASASQSPTTPTKTTMPNGDNVSEQGGEGSKVVTVAMLKALTKNMKERYRS